MRSIVMLYILNIPGRSINSKLIQHGTITRRFDFVESTQIGRVCGLPEESRVFESASESIRLEFRSDSMIHWRGYQATFQLIPKKGRHINHILIVLQHLHTVSVLLVFAQTQLYDRYFFSLTH